MTANLHSGPFGSAAEVCTRAQAVFTAAGYSPAADPLAVHPMLDNFVWESLDDRSEIGSAPDGLIMPISGNPNRPSRWFARDHPADASLREHLAAESRTVLEIDDLTDPSAAFADRVAAASELIGDVIPDIWVNTMPFVSRVFDTGSERAMSTSFDHSGGAILLSSWIPSDLEGDSSRVALAENLLHEAAHSKSYRVFRSFDSVSVPDSAEFIDIPWWRTTDKNWEWDVDRSVVACHVYTHLAVFYKELSARNAQYERRGAQSAFRARFLSNMLLQLPPLFITQQWRDFVEWTGRSIPTIEGLGSAGRAELDRRVDSFPNYAHAVHLLTA